MTWRMFLCVCAWEQHILKDDILRQVFDLKMFGDRTNKTQTEKQKKNSIDSDVMSVFFAVFGYSTAN